MNVRIKVNYLLVRVSACLYSTIRRTKKIKIETRFEEDTTTIKNKLTIKTTYRPRLGRSTDFTLRLFNSLGRSLPPPKLKCRQAYITVRYGALFVFLFKLLSYTNVSNIIRATPSTKKSLLKKISMVYDC